ncbi:hypothetical protein FHQ18_12120 [Deferribacter autotrophicus]|uniref:Uncharacterized protein n=1 Tax=Deferribacter autotrophicus TaxID=500465 RepID=A0A5A8F346_9BACT|nr:ATP-binding protein [Deferribacter autotrophicus]KAA0256865.1 hypothetical protein FHQ18_12120 [Deferribacter autotrophicus]
MSVILKRDRIYLESLIVIGFKLYPKCMIYFDKTFTSLFGKNGVGKTTLLDAIQIGLIANQHYTKFNITTQKDDRSLGDYMYGSAGYIVFNINSAENTAHINHKISFGIRLLKNPDMKVDIKPFAIENVKVIPDDFFDGNLLLDNFQILTKHLLNKYPEMRFQNFQTITEYHNYLYEKGILAINISSRISEFSTLYRSISTGILRQGKKMIKDMLSTGDSSPRKLIYSLTKSIKQRGIIVRKISQIKMIKEEISNLEEAAKEYYDKAIKYFSNQLNVYTSKLENAKTEIIDKETIIKKQNVEIEKINKILDKKSKELKFNEEQLEKLLLNISDLERNFRAYEQYSSISNELKKIQSELIEIQKVYKKLYDELTKKQELIAELKSKKHTLEIEKAKIEGELKALSYHYKNYLEFQKHFQKMLEITKEKVDNLTDFERVLNYWEQVSKDIENLHFFKKEYDALLEKLEYHRKASTLKNKLKSIGITFTSKEELQKIAKAKESEIFNLKKQKEAYKEEIIEKNREVNELLKGKIVLPDTLKNFKGKFLYKMFDNVSLEESEKLESILGELKYAAILEHPDEIYSYAKGNRRLYFINKKDINIDDFIAESVNDGYLVTDKNSPNIIRFEPKPKYPIIGEKSRKQKADALLNEIKVLEKEIDEIEQKILSNSNILNDINNLIYIFEYLDMAHLENEVQEKQKQIELIEEKSFIYKKIKNDFTIIQRLKSYYARDDYKQEYLKASDKLEKIKEEFIIIQEEVKKIEKELQAAEVQYTKAEKDIQDVERRKYELEATKKQLENEYPMEILKGEIDFTEIEVLHREKEKLKNVKEKLQNEIDELKDKRRKIEYRQEKLVEEIKRLKENIQIYEEKLHKINEEANSLIKEDISPKQFNITESEFYKSKGVFEKELENFLKKHEKNYPESSGILEQFNDAVVKVFPNFQSLSKLQEDLEKLNVQLLQIEEDIKAVIGNFKTGIEENIYKIKSTLRKLNNDLKSVRFGKIRQIRLRVEERSAYHKLQKIHQSGSIMSLLESDNVDFEEFIKELGKNLGYNRAQVTENDVLDYKNYFDIEIELFDEFGNLRNRGLSNGENLGTNIVIVLSMLTRLSDESLKNKMLPIVLDEADRLDADSLNTLYEIAKNWGLQLIVALPNLPNFNKGMHYHLISGENGVVMPHVRFELNN